MKLHCQSNQQRKECNCEATSKKQPPFLEPIYSFHEEAIEFELMLFCQPFLELHNQHETIPDSLSEANIAPHQLSQLNPKYIVR